MNLPASKITRLLIRSHPFDRCKSCSLNGVLTLLSCQLTASNCKNFRIT